ncbi:unnamed protein product [Dovyalis caffra]|uniref:NADH dehydrogenase subunit 6 n=1 Tax=Dovyalis caffra TaxID=77055 RepID=A0AAV1SL27_9ROSI|nr:unnamed protein product [Dovyalis caffra]
MLSPILYMLSTSSASSLLLLVVPPPFGPIIARLCSVSLLIGTCFYRLLLLVGGVELGCFFYMGLHTPLLASTGVFVVGPSRARSGSSWCGYSPYLAFHSLWAKAPPTRYSSSPSLASSLPREVVVFLDHYRAPRPLPPGLPSSSLQGKLLLPPLGFNLVGNSTSRLMKFKNGLPAQRDPTLEHRPSIETSTIGSRAPPPTLAHLPPLLLAWNALIKVPDRLPLLLAPPAVALDNLQQSLRLTETVPLFLSKSVSRGRTWLA